MEFLQNFGLTFGKCIRENLRPLLLKMAGLVVVLCIIALWIGYVNNTSGLDSVKYDSAHGTELSLFAIMFIFTTMACASGAMSFMSSKEDRLSMLMLPSTTMSKFLTAWIISVPLATIVFIVFAQIADLLRCLVYMPMGGVVEPLTFSYVDSTPLQVFFMFVMVGQSLFMLGGTIWNKRAFIKTIVALWIIGLVYAMLVHFGFEIATLDKPYYSGGRMADVPKMWMFWSVAIVISLGIYVLSYFRFRESEIVNRW